MEAENRHPGNSPAVLELQRRAGARAGAHMSLGGAAEAARSRVEVKVPTEEEGERRRHPAGAFCEEETAF